MGGVARGVVLHVPSPGAAGDRADWRVLPRGAGGGMVVMGGIWVGIFTSLIPRIFLSRADFNIEYRVVLTFPFS